MKTAFLCFQLMLAITISTRLTADSIEVSGAVSGTWDADTVNVIGDIQIREVETVEISPGTLVLFRGEFYFKVQGCLRAIGTESLPICFTIDDTTGFHNDTISRGGWKQIRIEDIPHSIDSSIFRFCEFSYGKAVATDSIHGYGGAVCIRNTDRVSITHCTFTNNYAYHSGGAVYLENANILVSNNHFVANRCGQTFEHFGYGGGICSDWSEPLIRRNIFTLNSSTGIAGGLCVRYTDCTVSHNIFDNNFSALGGGFGILHIDTCHYVISNNLIISNGAEFFGAGISNNDCSPMYVNNTICNNHCIGGGGGFYCKDSVVPVLYNNILYGNTQYGEEPNQVYLWDLLAQPDFYYNNIEGGAESFAGTGGTAYSGTYENNMDMDPLFGVDNYIPEPLSPCVNAGIPDTIGLKIPPVDLAGYDRIVGNIIDIGAYEYQDPVNVFETGTQQIQFSNPEPNPMSDFTTFTLTLQSPQTIRLMILNSNGRFIALVSYKHFDTGMHKIYWKPGTKLPPGFYFAVLSKGGHQYARKLIIR